MPKRNLIWIIVIALVAMGTAWVTRPPLDPHRVTSGEVDSLANAYRCVSENYYHRIDPGKLRRQLIERMVDELDQYSRYIPPPSANAFRNRVMGKSRCAGLKLRRNPAGEYIVSYVAKNSPADKADLGIGDLLVTIDGQDVGQMPMEEVEGILMFASAPKVRMRVKTSDTPVRLVELVADGFEVESVMGLCRRGDDRWDYMVSQAKGIAYFRINEFVSDTPDEFRKAFRRLRNVKGVIVDVRANPGGLLPQTVSLTNLFLSEGTIVTTFRRDESPQSHVAHADGTYPDIPIVVLIDSDTASAAEIFAGALGQSGRALLVGTRTRGKDYIQSMFDLGEGLGVLNLTTSRFVIGPGSEESATTMPEWQGVQPHVVVNLPQGKSACEQVWMKARSAGRRDMRTPTTMPAEALAIRKVVTTLADADPQFARAVSLLSDEGVVQSMCSKIKAAHERKMRHRASRASMAGER